ncbi:MAG TPA: hypothetical protein VEX18_07035 [Polyangiaceae bacterium]|nr:hypothetical protein [Polyangiaceae bacterium]
MAARAIKSSGFEPEAPWPARFDYLLDQVPLLVHLDREYAAVVARILVLGDGLDEGFVDALDAIGHDVREAEQQRQVEPARLELLR